jgi:hypothetical protein
LRKSDVLRLRFDHEGVHDTEDLQDRHCELKSVALDFARAGMRYAVPEQRASERFKRRCSQWD